MEKEVKVERFEIVRRNLEVIHTEFLNPGLKLIKFHSEELEGFKSLSPDDHIKVFFDGGEMRDFTPVEFDPSKKELTLIFHLHDGGVASEWARAAQPGAQLNIGGPRGSRIVPYEFDWYLFVTDESGIPSLIRYLNEMPEYAKVRCLIEVESPDFKIELPNKKNISVDWVFRKDIKENEFETIKESLNNLLFSEGEGFIWIMQEKSIAMALKAFLVDEKGVNPKRMKATGYWRR